MLAWDPSPSRTRWFCWNGLPIGVFANACRKASSTFVGALVHFFDVVVFVVGSCVSYAVFVVECLVAFVSDIVLCVLLRRRVVSERPPGACWSKLSRYMLEGQTCGVAL